MKPSPSLLATLQKLPIFQDFSPTQLMKLFQICGQETYEKGTMLCKEGTESDQMHILLSGAVEVHIGRDMLVAREEAVTTIGEAGLLTGKPRAASVVTETPVQALVIDRRPLQQLMQQDPTLGLRLYRNGMVMLRQKLIAADHRIEELSKAPENQEDELPPAETGLTGCNGEQ